MHQRRNHKEESDVNTEETFNCDQCNYIYTKNNTLRAHFIKITKSWRKRCWNATDVITHGPRNILLECIKA